MGYILSAPDESKSVLCQYLPVDPVDPQTSFVWFQNRTDASGWTFEDLLEILEPARKHLEVLAFTSVWSLSRDIVLKWASVPESTWPALKYVLVLGCSEKNEDPDDFEDVIQGNLDKLGERRFVGRKNPLHSTLNLYTLSVWQAVWKRKRKQTKCPCPTCVECEEVSACSCEYCEAMQCPCEDCEDCQDPDSL